MFSKNLVLNYFFLLPGLVLLSITLSGRLLFAQDSKSSETDSRKTVETTNTAVPTEKNNNIWEMAAFELPTTTGETRSLSYWKGKVILLNFWASWCAPCQFEIPRFVRYQKKYADKGLQIIGIGLDDKDKLKNVERSLEINYPTMVISQQKGAKLLEKFGDEQQIVPYTLLIDKDGSIVYIHRGSMQNEDFEEYVLPLL